MWATHLLRSPGRRKRSTGFSLLEVLMAVALFGAVVTIILSAQAGLVASDRTATNMSQAIEIARCRMSEIEEKQLRLGFPEIEEKDQSTVCCNDREVTGYSCDWQVERVLLPQPMGLAGEGGLTSLLNGGLDAGLGNLGTTAAGLATSMPTSVAGPMGTTLLNPAGGAALNFDAGLQNIGQTLTQSFGGSGMSGLLSLVFSLVYPSLKPMLEAGIRRVTVTVHWQEGSQTRDMMLQQYITNPSRSGLLAGLAEAGLGGEGGLPINMGGSGATPGGGSPFGGAAPPPITGNVNMPR
jgi:general secretion pathway protein I